MLIYYMESSDQTIIFWLDESRTPSKNNLWPQVPVSLIEKAPLRAHQKIQTQIQFCYVRSKHELEH